MKLLTLINVNHRHLRLIIRGVTILLHLIDGYQALFVKKMVKVENELN